MSNAILTTQTTDDSLLLKFADKDGRTPSKTQLSRINQFSAWLDDTGQNILNMTLADYRDYLLNTRGLKPSSVSSHLSSLRGIYQRLLSSNDLRDYLYSFADHDDSTADKKAFVDEMIERLKNASDSRNSRVSVTIKQDTADSDHIRLTMPQVKSLLQKALNHKSELVGLRDCALLSLALATGARAGELVNVTVDDLRQTLGGKLALRVTDGKGGKQRMIPYGQFANALNAVDRWLEAVEITDGYVFRSLDRHGNIRDNMTTRAIIKVLKRYPVMIDGKSQTINPHDMRRTYARLMYDNGMPLKAIQDNLGHSNYDTTIGYIGTMDADKRQPTISLPIPMELERM